MYVYLEIYLYICIFRNTFVYMYIFMHVYVYIYVQAGILTMSFFPGPFNPILDTVLLISAFAPFSLFECVCLNMVCIAFLLFHFFTF